MKKILLFSSSLLCALTMVLSCDRGPLVLKEGNVEKVTAALTLEEKVHLLVGTSTSDSVSRSVHGIVPGTAGTTYPVERLGIPAMVLSDGPNGIRMKAFTTCFPVGTMLASTWNHDLIWKEGEAMGEDALSHGIDVILAPGINIHRNPLNGRNFEYYSEDPLVAGETAAAFIGGVQSKGVGTSLKHFAVNNQELNRLANDARVSERALREIYLKAFEIAVKKSCPWTVMSSYNRLNGLYACENRTLLTDLLRDEWKFDGYVMSDWGAGVDNAGMILAGNDNIQNGSDGRYEEIMAAVRDGRISEEVLDLSVGRILKTVLRSPNYLGVRLPDSVCACRQHLDIARAVAEEGIVLLKNDYDALPLSPGSVAVFGSSAYDWIPVGGGSGDVNCEFKAGILEGLRESGFELSKAADSAYQNFMAEETMRTDNIRKEVGYWRNASVRPTELPDLPALVGATLEEGTQYAVIVIGRKSTEGIDRLVEDDFNLNPDELSMIRTVSEAYRAEGKKVVLVLNTCCAVETESWSYMVDAIVETWLPGQMGGYALGDVLSGKVCPSGHLTMTFPRRYEDVPSADNFPQVKVETRSNPSFYRFSKEPLYEKKDIDYTNYEEGIYVGYRYYLTSKVKTAYPFGFGLSYTDFEWSDMNVQRSRGGWKVSCKVTNTGKFAGREVVQLYVSAPEGLSIDMPERELRGYAKTALLSPGESETVSIFVKDLDLASFYEKDNAWRTAPGEYLFRLAKHSEDNGICSEVKVRKAAEFKSKVSLAPQGNLFIK